MTETMPTPPEQPIASANANSETLISHLEPIMESAKPSYINVVLDSATSNENNKS